MYFFEIDLSRLKFCQCSKYNIRYLIEKTIKPTEIDGVVLKQ